MLLSSSGPRIECHGGCGPRRGWCRATHFIGSHPVCRSPASGTSLVRWIAGTQDAGCAARNQGESGVGPRSATRKRTQRRMAWPEGSQPQADEPPGVGLFFSIAQQDARLPERLQFKIEKGPNAGWPGQRGRSRKPMSHPAWVSLYHSRAQQDAHLQRTSSN